MTHNWDTDSYDLGNGFGHLAIEVDDVYKAAAQIDERGGKKIQSRLALGQGYYFNIFIGRFPIGAYDDAKMANR